jgi:ActR/RegA family two-component response regulator
VKDCRLLILDDDPGFGCMIQRIAASVAIPSRHVARPEEFFEATKTWKPTHIAIDLKVLDVDGVKVIEELARLGCTAELIVLAASMNEW